MSTDPRIFSILDDLEGVPFEPIFRIPPLQDPLPFIPSRRPSPLEPIARVNDGTRNATAKLSSRSNALTEARPIGDDDSPTTYRREKTIETAPTKSTGPAQEARKRQKLDFVQLPEPTTRSKTSKPPSFKPVPVLLNELHEPPPSAALFPPITPKIQHEGDQQSRSHQSQPQCEEAQSQEKQNKSRKLEVVCEKEQQGRGKRIYLRGRRNWTDKETDFLLKGVGIYGIGKWKKILNHDGFSFHPERTTVDLKDRYRTCRMNEERALERQASEGTQTGPMEFSVESIPSKTALPLSVIAESRKSPNSSTSLKPQTTEDQSFKNCTPESFSQYVSSLGVGRDAADKDGKNKMTAPRWTNDEDANLSKGYQKYGFQWTAIAKDPDMKLNHRTGAQVRDRFRLKFPAHYQASVPLPLPVAPKKASRKTSPPPQFTFIVHDIAKPPDSGRGRARVESTDAKSPSKPKNACERSELPLHMERDVFQGLNVQPLPDANLSPSPESTSPVSHTTGEGSRQTSAEAEDARHLGILGLLNDEDEQSSRLPPFKYTFDDDWGGDSVTLPPLLWEDMASRPIFDLE